MKKGEFMLPLAEFRYIDKALTNLRPEHTETLNKIREQGVTIVNSLEELKGALK